MIRLISTILCPADRLAFSRGAVPLGGRRALAMDQVTFGENEPEETKLSLKAQQFLVAVTANPDFPPVSLPFLKILLSEGIWFKEPGVPAQWIKHPARLSEQLGKDKSTMTQNVRRWLKDNKLIVIEDENKQKRYWLHDALKQ